MTGTIAAIATPFGPGAIAVLRVSGEEAWAVTARALGKVGLEGWAPRLVRLASVRDADGVPLLHEDAYYTLIHRP